MSRTTRLATLLAFAQIAIVGPVAAQGMAQISAAKWLVGCWTRPEPRGGETAERWQAAEGNTMFGMGRTIRGDTVRSYELTTMSIIQGKLTYTAHLAKQLPTPFTATTVNDSLLVFENPTHDFPQEIRYRKVNADSFVASIAGPQGGKRVEIPTPFKRTACPAWK